VNKVIATDERGNALLTFRIGEETDLDDLDHDLPCLFSLVLVWHEGRCLMVFDHWKQAWELPGGARQEGETPRAAALRELAEETGESPATLSYVGVASFRLAPDGLEESGAIYQAHIESPAEFVPNDEIEQVTWWDPADALEGADGPDTAIVQLVHQQSH
jgi:8-oxo-dGTP diphosphatase